MTYKFETRRASLGDVENAVSDLEELGDECQEIVDNASDGLRETQRIQTLEETAGSLTGLSAPDVPEGFDTLEFSYGYSSNKRKGRGPSRAVRRDNAVSLIQNAADAAREKAEELRKQAEEKSDEAEDAVDLGARTEQDEANAASEKLTEQADALDEFAEECEAIVGDAEGCEFPGMYG